MKSLLAKGITGIAALLLAAAAIALIVFAFAILLGVAAVLGLVAAGVFIGAPADAKTLVRDLIDAVGKWLADFERIVANAGDMMLTALGRGKTDVGEETAQASGDNTDTRVGSAADSKPDSEEKKETESAQSERK